jgi:hydroxypyruvate reductase
VDGTTVVRAAASGLDVSRALSSFGAYPLFQSLRDAVVTGPTGNNVRDLRVLLAE